MGGKSLTSKQAHLRRGRIWTGDGVNQAPIEDGVLEMDGGFITTVRPALASDAPADLDKNGQPYTFLPGLLDLHNHGGGGHSFPTSEAEGCRRAARYHLSRGTTTMLASLVSASKAALVRQAAVLADLADDGTIAGIHCEGPFLSPVRCGAQAPQMLIPADSDLLCQIIESARGHLRSITIAPEVKNYSEVISLCAQHGIVVSLGHSDASADQAEAALEAAENAGVSVTATHLFNGMPPMHHREPGIAGALLHAATQRRVVVELIADGVHLDKRLVGIVLAAAPENTLFVSDAMAAAGVGDGDYILGGAKVTVHQGTARIAAASGELGSVAGGTSALVDQVLRHAGAALLTRGPHPVEEITQAARSVLAATKTPAHALGLLDRGSLQTGLRADVLTLDSSGLVTEVLSQRHAG